MSLNSYGDMIDDIDDLDKEEKVRPEIKEPEKRPVKPVVKSPSSTKVETQSPPKESLELKAEKKNAAKSPINLKSDGKSTYSRDGGQIVLRKNVVITQDELRLQADEAKVFVDTAAEKDNSVREMQITGHVKMSKFSKDPSERVTAHGERAVFKNSSQTVKLIGNARLFKGGHLIKGKEIVYDIQSGLITVDEAQGVVQPEEAQKQ